MFLTTSFFILPKVCFFMTLLKKLLGIVGESVMCKHLTAFKISSDLIVHIFYSWLKLEQMMTGLTYFASDLPEVGIGLLYLPQVSQVVYLRSGSKQLA